MNRVWRVKRDGLYLGPGGWTSTPLVDGFVYYMLGPARAAAKMHPGAKVMRITLK